MNYRSLKRRNIIKWKIGRLTTIINQYLLFKHTGRAIFRQKNNFFILFFCGSLSIGVKTLWILILATTIVNSVPEDNDCESQLSVRRQVIVNSASGDNDGETWMLETSSSRSWPSVLSVSAISDIRIFFIFLNREKASVLDPWHFGVDPDPDPDPRVHASD